MLCCRAPTRFGLLSGGNGESPPPDTGALLPILAADDEEEEEEEEAEEEAALSTPETLPTMDRTWESRYHHSYRCGPDVATWIGKILLVGALWIASVMIAANSVHGDSSGTCHESSSSPITGRWIAVTRCIQELSHLTESEMLTPQSHSFRLALWFMGPGYNIAVDHHHCAWGAPFADLYALLLFRDIVKVRNPSWYQERDGDIAVPSELDVCEWKRVKCENGKVTGLIFNNAGLYGSLPSEIGGLVHLKQLHIYDNPGLMGTIPTQIGDMASLISLQLHKTEVEGTIPTELGRLVQLEELLLEETLLTGTMPSQLCGLSHLSTLKANCEGETASVQCSCCTSCH